MTIDQILFGILGVLLGIIGNRLLDYMRGTDTVLSLQRDNQRLEAENKSLRQKLADYAKAELDRIAKEKCQENHGRSEQEVDILRMLATESGQTVRHIADTLTIGCELAIAHLVNLRDDGLVESPNYPDDPDWDTGCKPYDSTWHIRQPGRNYLASNNLLK